MATELATSDSVLRVCPRNPEDHLHDERRRIAQFLAEKSYQNACGISERTGSIKAVVPGAAQRRRKMGHDTRMVRSLESIHATVGGSHSGSNSSPINGFRLRLISREYGRTEWQSRLPFG